MLPCDRPKASLAKRLPIFTSEQIEQTLAVSTEPYRTLFTVAALTGARISELCGLTWADVTIDNLDEAEITFGFKVDRHGNRRPTRTDGSARTVPIPRELALVLARHMRSVHDPRSEAFMFATRTGRPLGQRNVARELRKGQQRANDDTDSRRFRSCTKQTRPAVRSRRRLARCHRCTRSGTPSPLGRCWQARAWTSWPSSSAIAMPRSRVSSTSARSLTPGAGTRAARMTAEVGGALRIALGDDA